MSGLSPPLSPEARALLDEERSPPVQPAAVRLRALTRARAALTANPHAFTPALARSHRTRWFTAAAVICAVAIAAGAAAYELRARFAADAPVAARAPEPRPQVRAAAARSAPVAESEIGNQEIGNQEGQRTNRSAAASRTPSRERARPVARTPSHDDGAERELRILRPARAAVAEEDFTAALGPIAEHARRFKDGRLAEEREALRVKSLAGLGRLDEARRAAAAFGARFPTSVLLPAVGRLAETGR